MPITIYLTCSNKEEAKKISRALLEAKAAACCHIYPSQIEALYLWESKIQSAKEIAMVIKTIESKLELAKKIIIQNHSYEVPCLASFEMQSLNESCSDWIYNSLN